MQPESVEERPGNTQLVNGGYENVTVPIRRLIPLLLAQFVGQFRSISEMSSGVKWSQGDSNPCYRRERPAS